MYIMTKIKKKEDFTTMKKLFVKMGTKLVSENAKREADSACLFWAYQPKMPEAVKKMRKENK